MLTIPAAPHVLGATASSNDILERRIAAMPELFAQPPAVWEHLWFTLLQHPWSSLALVPAQKGLDTLAVARVLASVSQAYLDQLALVADATHILPAEVPARQRACRERAEAGGRVIVATSSPMERAACIPMARGADAVVLLVELGSTSLSEARRTLELLGPVRCLGAIALKS